MQSNNPVFRRSDGFNGRVHPASGMSYPAYGTAGGAGYAGYAGSGYAGTADATGYGRDLARGPMTIDSVVQKTAITMGLLVVAAVATWVLLPVQSSGLAMGAALVGMVLGFVASFKRVVSPPLVLAYAVFEGVFLGAVSHMFNLLYPGIVMNAVLGTLVAFAGTLAAYKFFNISVTPKFRKFVVAASFAFVGLVLLDLVLGLFGLSFGWNGYGALGFVSSLVGLGLGVLMLILDFDYVEQGVRAGLPEQESWRAAFGLTVTLVWLYIELIRLLAILRGD